MISALLIAGILQGFWLVVMLAQKPGRALPNRLLICLLLIVTAHLVLVSLDIRDLFLRFPHLSRLSWLLPLLYGPLILLLTESIVKPAFKLQRKHLLYFSVFALYLLLLSPYYFSPAHDKLAILLNTERLAQADFGWMNHLTNYVHIGFVVASIIIYSRREQSAKFEARWLGRFLKIFLGILLFSLVTFYGKKFSWPYLEHIYPAHFLLAVALMYWLAYQVAQTESNLQQTEPEIAEKSAQPKYSRTGMEADRVNAMAEQLREIMLTRRPYLNPELTLADLSELLSVSKHQLSQVINAAFGVNFYEFVNSYRLEAFKQAVTDPAYEHLSLLGIALECGFNSKAAFNQYFRKKECVTPSEFLKSVKSPDSPEQPEYPSKI